MHSVLYRTAQIVFFLFLAVVTDGNGYYDLAAALLVSGHEFGNDVTIAKAGYEDTHAWVPASTT